MKFRLNLQPFKYPFLFFFCHCVCPFIFLVFFFLCGCQLKGKAEIHFLACLSLLTLMVSLCCEMMMLKSSFLRETNIFLKKNAVELNYFDLVSYCRHCSKFEKVYAEPSTFRHTIWNLAWECLVIMSMQ